MQRLVSRSPPPPSSTLHRSPAGGTQVYGYDAENRLIAGPDGVTLRYDPLGRLFEIAQGGTVASRFVYDGDALVLEYDGAGNRLQRHVHLDGADTPVLSYHAGETAPRQLMPDHLGSIVSMTRHGGNRIVVNSYDEYGYPGAGNTGRFQYTGQAWLAELGLYHYKARMYSPGMGRFLQTDPIGYGDGLDWYDYVGGDPVNRSDPSGTKSVIPCPTEICVDGRPGDRFHPVPPGGGSYFPSPAGMGVVDAADDADYVVTVTGRRKIKKATVGNRLPQNIPCKEGVDCKVSWPKPLPPTCKAPFRCGPAPKPVPKKRLFGTHWCGPGGGGPTTGALDEACRAHDNCYGDNGLGVSSNFSRSPVPGLQQCNQALCDASQGQGTAGFLVRSYFRNAPMPSNACRWDR